METLPGEYYPYKNIDAKSALPVCAEKEIKLTMGLDPQVSVPKRKRREFIRRFQELMSDPEFNPYASTNQGKKSDRKIA